MTLPRSMLTLAAIAALSTSATSCRGTTALHFVVCLDFDPNATPVRAIRVKINNAAGLSLTGATGQEITVTSETRFPLRFSVYAANSLTESVSVTVEALLANVRPSMMADITARVNTRFVAGEVRSVPIVLEQACVGRSMQCTIEQTCRAGMCAPAELDTSAQSAYSPTAMCGASGADASVSDASTPSDGGECAVPANTLDLIFPQDTARVSRLALSLNNGVPGAYRIAALVQNNANVTRLYVTRARVMGGTLVSDGALNSVEVAGAPLSLSWTRTGVVAATQTQVVHSADATTSAPITTWAGQIGTGPVAGTYMGASGLEAQLCTFVGANLTCRVYADSTTLTEDAMVPPPVSTAAGNATMIAMEGFGAAAPLVGAFRSPTAIGRCALINMGAMPSCAPMMLPMFTNATASFTADSGLAVAIVDARGAVQAAIAAPTTTMPALVQLGTAMSTATLATSTSTMNEVLVAASEPGRISLFRLGPTRAAQRSTVVTSAPGGDAITALSRADTVPSLGEHHVIAYAVANNRAQLRLVPANACR